MTNSPSGWNENPEHLEASIFHPFILEKSKQLSQGLCPDASPTRRCLACSACWMFAMVSATSTMVSLTHLTIFQFFNSTLRFFSSSPTLSTVSLGFKDLYVLTSGPAGGFGDATVQEGPKAEGAPALDAEPAEPGLLDDVMKRNKYRWHNGIPILEILLIPPFDLTE